MSKIKGQRLNELNIQNHYLHKQYVTKYHKTVQYEKSDER